MRPFFNESFGKKRGLWVLWTVHEIHWKPITATERKSKKKKKRETRKKQYAKRGRDKLDPNNT